MRCLDGIRKRTYDTRLPFNLRCGLSMAAALRAYTDQTCEAEIVLKARMFVTSSDDQAHELLQRNSKS